MNKLLELKTYLLIALLFCLLISCFSCLFNSGNDISENLLLSNQPDALYIWELVQPKYQESLRILYAQLDIAVRTDKSFISTETQDGHKRFLINDKKYKSLSDIKTYLQEVFSDAYIENNFSDYFNGSNAIYVEESGNIYMRHIDMPYFLESAASVPEIIQYKDGVIDITFPVSEDMIVNSQFSYTLIKDNTTGNWLIDKTKEIY